MRSFLAIALIAAICLLATAAGIIAWALRGGHAFNVNLLEATR